MATGSGPGARSGARSCRRSAAARWVAAPDGAQDGGGRGSRQALGGAIFGGAAALGVLGVAVALRSDR